MPKKNPKTTADIWSQIATKTFLIFFMWQMNVSSLIWISLNWNIFFLPRLCVFSIWHMAAVGWKRITLGLWWEFCVMTKKNVLFWLFFFSPQCILKYPKEMAPSSAAVDCKLHLKLNYCRNTEQVRERHIYNPLPLLQGQQLPWL